MQVKRITGRDVKRLRRKVGLTQAEFAKRLRVHRTTVARWEIDKAGLSYDSVQKLLNGLDVSLDSIFLPKTVAV